MSTHPPEPRIHPYDRKNCEHGPTWRERAMDKPEPSSWDVAARQYLDRLGAAEYRAFKVSKHGKRARFSPSEYHRDLVTLLNQNDEHGFKSLKALRGCDSALGV